MTTQLIVLQILLLGHCGGSLWKAIYNSLDIDLIHDDIDIRSSKNPYYGSKACIYYIYTLLPGKTAHPVFINECTFEAIQNKAICRNWNVNMMPTVCHELKCESCQTGNVTLSITLSSPKTLHLTSFGYAGYDSATKTKLYSIPQPSKIAVLCGIGRSWNPRVKPNLGSHSSIPISMLCILVLFELVTPQVEGATSV